MSSMNGGKWTEESERETDMFRSLLAVEKNDRLNNLRGRWSRLAGSRLRQVRFI